MKNRVLILFLFFTIFPTVFGQNKLKEDSLSVIYSLKFKILERYSKTIDIERLKEIDSLILKTNIIEVEKIENKGFNNFQFYKIIDKRIPLSFREYIVGYQIDGGRYYRIKGFLNNDFYYLYKFEIRNDSKFPISSMSNRSKKYFLKNHFIEGVDLECLIKHINSKETWKIPCLDPHNVILIDDFGEEYL